MPEASLQSGGIYCSSVAQVQLLKLSSQEALTRRGVRGMREVTSVLEARMMVGQKDWAWLFLFEVDSRRLSERCKVQEQIRTSGQRFYL